MKWPSGPRPSDTQNTPTHPHRSPMRHGITWTPLPLLSASPLAARTPSTRHRITLVARICAPSAENRSDVQKSPFSRFFSCVLYPRYTTHIRAPAFHFSPAITIAPYRSWTLRVCVFSNTFFRENDASRTLTVYPISSDLLPFVSPNLLSNDKPRASEKETRPGLR